MRRLDPRIHPEKFLFFDGLPGRQYEDALRAFARQ
jgi:hypothetical protein